MPMYAYRCTACGAEEEHIQRFSDPPMTKCEACGGLLEKLLTAAGFQLKGAGWYKDGYASARPGGGSSGGEGDGGGGKTDGGKTDGGKADGGKADSGKSDSGSGKDKPKGGSSAKAAAE